MKNKVRLLIDFAKGKNPINNKVRIFSIIGGRKELLEEKPIDVAASITIEVCANDEKHLELCEKSLSMNLNNN